MLSGNIVSLLGQIVEDAGLDEVTTKWTNENPSLLLVVSLQ